MKDHKYGDIYRTVAINFTDGTNKIQVERSYNGTWIVSVSNTYNSCRTVLDLSKPSELQLHEQYVEFARGMLNNINEE